MRAFPNEAEITVAISSHPTPSGVYGNGWGFSGAYTAVNLADFTLMWLFAGLAISKVARSRARD